MEILLASNSPRRKELLRNLGYDFRAVAIDCDETFPDELPPCDVAAYLSRLKSDSFGTLKENQVLITADTVVVLDNQILGKPKDEQDAFRMIRNLSGKKHQVFTAITVRTPVETITETDVAIVEFSDMTDEEIQYYIQHFKPFDKAGSYGIQEWLGMAKISKIEGNFYTIMGLPTHLLYQILKMQEAKLFIK
ncbi:MAG: Maf family protein [Bergeyella sp.]